MSDGFKTEIVLDLAQHAVAAFGNAEDAMEWLKEPNDEFYRGKTPLAFGSSGEAGFEHVTNFLAVIHENRTKPTP